MSNEQENASTCPLCGKANQCGLMTPGSEEACWCMKVTFPPEIFELVPPELRDKSCICKDCLDSFKQTQSRSPQL
ncbi:cysteine-rich CWC family protein [Gorillibacterium massiliense]|uniref:cysteine-rich CWC family protein n=1 Tax=Gorillibacterium massiliense TaxID=1280390 RepID=UPI002351EB20|nr:cysteine-rich CWC family protein [Gorillibacterium massiliense]